MLDDSQNEIKKPNLIGMIYPGAMSGLNSLISVNKHFFGYSTIDSIYVYQQNPIKIVNIIPSNMWIYTLSLAPHKLDHLAVGYKTNNVVMVFNHAQNKIVQKIETKNPIACIGWSANDTKLICFTLYYNEYFIYDIETKEETKFTGSFGNIRILASTRSYPPVLVGGNSSGVVSKIFKSNAKMIDYHERGAVLESVIDPNNESNALIVWKHGWALFNISGAPNDLTVMHEVLDNSFSLSSACWSSFIPGQFFTGDSISGIIRIWNISSDKPNELLNLHSSGVHKIHELKGNRILCSFKDGMIGVYDIENRKFLMKNVAGHLNTIFSIRKHPCNDDVLISGGSEGAICSWSLSSMNQIDRICSKELNDSQTNLGHLYSMEVSPGGGLVACGYEFGSVAFFSLQTKVKISTQKIGEKPVICISFNPNTPETILVSCREEGVYAFDVQKRTVLWKLDPNFQPSIAKYSPHSSQKDHFYVTTVYGGLLVFNSLSNSPIIKIDDASQHLTSGTIFNVAFIAFSPNDENIIATTDEYSIKLWNIKDKTFKVIHKEDNLMRGLSFHHSIPNLLAFGGYRGFVTLYDISQNKIISQFQAHVAPVYSIEMHNLMLITSAADTSIKFWSIDNLYPKTILSDLILNKSDFWLKPLEGLKQIVKLTKRCVKAEKLNFSTTDVVHINDILKITSKSIAHSMSGALRETRLIKRAIKSKERMVQNAKLELFMGNPKKYCEYMFTAGDFDLAVAASPAVSVTFWVEMMKNRMKLLEDEDQIADYNLAIGNSDKAIDELMKAKMADKAFLIAAAKKQGSFNLKSLKNPNKDPKQSPKLSGQKSKSISELKPKDENKISEIVPNLSMNLIDNVLPSTVDEQLHKQSTFSYIDSLFQSPAKWIEYKTASEWAKQCLKEGKIYLAAAAYLSIGDVVSCEYCLLKHGQLSTAIYVDLITKTKLLKVFDKFAMCAILNGLEKEFFSMEHLDVAEKERYVIGIRFNSIEERTTFYSSIGISTPEQYLASSSSNSYDKLHKILLSGKINEGIDFFLEKAKEMEDFCEVKDMTKLIEMINFDEVEDQRFLSIVVFSLYFAIYEAVYRGYKRIIYKMQDKLSNIVKNNNFDWGVKYVDETRKLINLIGELSNVTSINDSQARIYSAGFNFLNPQPLGTPFVPTLMYGNLFILEDGKTKLTMEEALMWFGLTPFSPVTLREKIYIL